MIEQVYFIHHRENTSLRFRRRIIIITTQDRLFVQYLIGFDRLDDTERLRTTATRVMWGEEEVTHHGENRLVPGDDGA